MLEKSCGTIPYTLLNGVIHYLLVGVNGHNIGFPKGHVEKDETEAQTALRETMEETSLAPVIRAELRYETTYKLDNGNQKTVVYFPADFGTQVPHHNQGFEDFDYMILPYEEAYSTITFENTREILRSVNDHLRKECFVGK